MAALDRAVALAEVHDVAVRVGEHLDLDVARLLDVALQVDGGVAERGLGLVLRLAHGGGKGIRIAHDADALAAAAAGRLDHERQADLTRHPLGGGGVGDDAVAIPA